MGVLANASDTDGDNLTAQLINGPSNGTLQLNDNGGFVYTPNSGYVGLDTFTFVVSDGVSTSTPATVTLSVNNSSSSTPVVTVTALTPTASEGNPSQNGVYQFSRTGATTNPLTVYYSLSDPADAGIEYTPLSGSVVIPSGQSYVNVALQPIPDPSSGPGGVAGASANPSPMRSDGANACCSD